MQSAQDVVVLVRSEHTASERRLSPAWSVAQLKARLEPITGIPAPSQRLTLQPTDAQPSTPLDPDAAQLAAFPLLPYALLYVHDTRPAHLRQSFNDVSSVEKYTMPASQYESLTDSVLHWKRTQQLGRFDPSLPDAHAQQAAHTDREIAERRIATGRRCRLLPPPTGQQGIPAPPEPLDRRGEVRFVGEIAEIPGVGKWIGVALDEPTGKNDGTVKGTRYFECPPNHGVFVRAERVEVGDFAPVNDFDDEDMEEI